MTYTGRCSPFKLIYNYEGNNYYHRIVLYLGKVHLVPPVKPSSYNHYSTDLRINLKYEYFFPIKILSNGKYRLYSGGTIENLSSIRKHFYINNKYHTYENYIFSIGPEFMIEYHPNKKNISRFQFSIPALTFMIHPPYSIKGKQTKKIAFLNNFMKIDFKIGYRYCFLRKFMMGFSYRLIYLKYSKLQKMDSGIDNLFVELLYKL
ncbi:hypothetical protein DRQ09_08215 [candidate division KSB1 bacterium]|nr:MAG: hypothetical protein DRQ09_08215 [candidate division KSB1 bacterium]